MFFRPRVTEESNIALRTLSLQENVRRFAKRLHQECDWQDWERGRLLTHDGRVWGLGVSNLPLSQSCQSHSWWSRLATRRTFSCIDNYQRLPTLSFILFLSAVSKLDMVREKAECIAVRACASAHFVFPLRKPNERRNIRKKKKNTRPIKKIDDQAWACHLSWIVLQHAAYHLKTKQSFGLFFVLFVPCRATS